MARSALRRSRKEFSFDDIAGISVQSSKGSKGGTVYRVVLKRKDGELVPFRSSSSSGSKGKERLAARVRDFIGVPGFDCSPAGMTYAALSPYTGLQETDGIHWTIQPTGAGRWHSPDSRTEGFFLCLAQKAENQASGGLLAPVGGMIFRKLLASRFQPEETPGLDRAAAAGLTAMVNLPVRGERNRMDWDDDNMVAQQEQRVLQAVRDTLSIYNRFGEMKSVYFVFSLLPFSFAVFGVLAEIAQSPGALQFLRQLVLQLALKRIDFVLKLLDNGGGHDASPD